jgi:hypothetical protein
MCPTSDARQVRFLVRHQLREELGTIYITGAEHIYTGHVRDECIHGADITRHDGRSSTLVQHDAPSACLAKSLGAPASIAARIVGARLTRRHE